MPKNGFRVTLKGEQHRRRQAEPSGRQKEEDSMDYFIHPKHRMVRMCPDGIVEAVVHPGKDDFALAQFASEAPIYTEVRNFRRC